MRILGRYFNPSQSLLKLYNKNLDSKSYFWLYCRQNIVFFWHWG